MHFGADGVATRFSGTPIFSWFLAPVIASVTLKPHLYLIRYTQNLPLDSPWYKYPFKERILNLESDKRKPFQSLFKQLY